ncbi:uncharacterized protein LAESUDRAFT_712365 [Laetiporus sulphureus 93-53]|uniref:DUF6533 domain-containing protein n=1 Tax=Laetiporus sulphureus 93-53 TaxID=1314785 RepID=A0A165FP55_9APHY|nr:uncharacterized protein LAESUDRAFT_712365 [Laetiporus sulphureus 93-53]KZT09264.1 hypothetical protein LAESUDRAFT_712365 [Laetiporus sulphureus 93-53]
MPVVILVKEVTSTTQEAIANKCCYTAAATLIFYEHWITFSDEVNLVWTSKWTTATIVFMCNRSLLVILGFTYVLHVLSWDTQADFRAASCELIAILEDAVVLATVVVISIFSALRVYAISIHNWVLASLVFLLSIAQTGIIIYVLSTTSEASVRALDGLAACVGHTPIPPETQQNTFKLAREARRFGTKAKLVQLLLRDGTLYFVALLIVNILELSVEYGYTDPESDGTYVSPLRLSADSLIPQVDIHLSSIGGLSMASFGSRLIDILGADLDFESSAEIDDSGREQTGDAGDCDRDRGSLIEMQVRVTGARRQQGS